MTVDLDPHHRAAHVRAYDVLGQPPRQDMSAVADLAARICGTPYAAVTLFTEDEQHHVATSGMDPLVCALEDSMCGAVLDLPSPVVVPDCRTDERLATNPFVTGELARLRFYASWRLVNGAGVVVGTLCVFDDVVRDLTPAQADSLGTLADRVVDILELQLRTRELQASLSEVEAVHRELERSNTLLASFAGQVSHDLKTPLTSMTMSLALIREEISDGEEDSPVLPLLDRAVAGSMRMAALIDDVLASAVLGDLRTEDVDLAEVVRHVRADLGDRLAGVDLSVGELPVVCGSPVQLRALVQNLLDNAAKFTHPDRRPTIRVTAQQLPQAWRIEVTDNGRGIPSGMTEEVFDPLRRLEETTPGVGLGLATCRRVLEAHDGRIGLVPAPGGGTTAWFELPLVRSAA